MTGTNQMHHCTPINPYWSTSKGLNEQFSGPRAPAGGKEWVHRGRVLGK